MIDREWHLANKMPRNPTWEQRLDWHRRHAEVCRCREMPEKVRNEIERRKASDGDR